MGLNLLSVPSGTPVFVDSNIFLYVFFRHPVCGKASHTFIKRIEDNDITGFVDEFVLNEVFHKLMITSVVEGYHCPPAQAVAVIKKSPEILNEFPSLWEACDMLKNIGVEIIPGPFFSDSMEIARQYNLFATDAVHVAAMRKEKLMDIATNDADFSRVPSLQIWKPEQG